MPEFLTEGDEIEFTPVGGWQWFTPFNGVVGAQPESKRPARVSGKQVLVENDLVALKCELVGKKYTIGVYQVPGSVADATIVVRQETLALPCHVDGGVPAVRTTCGTFQITCSPLASNLDGSEKPPILIKLGEWKVKSVQQSLAQSVCDEPRRGDIPK